MSIFDFFSSQGTAQPSTGSSTGDWMDWYLNREGPAGRFRGSRRPRYGIDYLFNDGGSVQSGPRTRQKLQPRSSDALGNVSDRYYREGNLEGMRRIGQEMQDRIQNHPSLQPGKRMPPIIEGGSIDPRSFWNVQAPRQPGANSGVMAAMSNNPMVQQAKGFYNLVDPWVPNVDVGENSFGYEFEKPLLGGTLGYGFDYDLDDENVGAFMNWKLGLGT